MIARQKVVGYHQKSHQWESCRRSFIYFYIGFHVKYITFHSYSSHFDRKNALMIITLLLLFLVYRIFPFILILPASIKIMHS